jgi:hypothetical protein
VLEFFRRSFAAETGADLADEMARGARSLGCKAVCRVEGEWGSAFRNSGGDASPMEIGALLQMKGHGRIFEFGSRISFSYHRAGMIVQDAPSDESLRGRLKDHFAMMCEGADARAKAIDLELAMSMETLRSAELSAKVGQAIAGIGARISEQSRTTMANLKVVMDEILEETLPLLDLSKTQEETLERQLDRSLQAFAKSSMRFGILESELESAAALLGSGIPEKSRLAMARAKEKPAPIAPPGDSSGDEAGILF